MIALLLASVAIAGPATEPSVCAVTPVRHVSGRYGSGRLWTILPTSGVIRVRPGPDGSLGWKLSFVVRVIRA